VVYTVSEGVKGAVRQIHFEGNAHFSEKVLRKEMKTRGKTLIYFVDKSGRLDEVQLEQTWTKSASFTKTTATSTWKLKMSAGNGPRRVR